MPLFICPGCGRRSVADRHAGHQPRGCASCGFGFLFELLDDYYPGPRTGLVVCDRSRIVIAAGHGAGAATGYREREMIGHEIGGLLRLVFDEDDDPIARSLEWGVRVLDVPCSYAPNGLGEVRRATLDLFPAYDHDGGLLVALTPLRGAALAQ